MVLTHLLETFFATHITKEATIWIAYSGGLDSHVLLHVSAEVCKKYSIPLAAIHVNHHLQADANAWSDHCVAICNTLNIPLTVENIKLAAISGVSLENDARQKRYDIFKKYLKQHDILLTAHHLDDQAETCLMQFMRGSGLKGLSAMPSIKPFSQGFHARPLLSVSRKELADYAKKHQLTWIEDDSNKDIKYTRNFLRQHIMPVLKSRWKNINHCLTRSALHCAEAQTLLEELTVDMIESCQGSKPNTLSVSQLKKLTEAKQKVVLRSWIHRNHYLLPNSKKTLAIIHNVIHAAPDAMPCVCWDQVEVRRYLDDLYIMETLPPHDVSKVYVWKIAEPLVIPSIGKLEVVSGSHSMEEVTVSFRQGGEVMHYARGKREVKKLFQTWAVPPWLRDRIPFVYFEDRLIAIVGYTTILEDIKFQLHCRVD